VFLTSTNAVTLEGTLVSIDGAGNRVAAMMFGQRRSWSSPAATRSLPMSKKALHRIHNVVAPLNALRHNLKHKQGEGLGWGFCRYTAIIDGCQPAEKGRISVILVGEDLGI